MGVVRDVVEQPFGLGVGVVLVVAGEHDHQPAAAAGHLLHRRAGQLGLLLELDEDLVHPLQLPRLVGKDLWDGVPGGGDVRVAEDDHGLGLGDGDEL